MYQEIAQLWIMDNSSWEYLLSVLLHLTLHLLKGDPPENRDTTLGGNLASTLLKTLFVCYLRASMVTRVSPALWDNLLAVLSSLTQWKEVVQQWQVRCVFLGWSSISRRLRGRLLRSRLYMV